MKDKNNHKYILYECYAIRGDIKHYFHFFFAVLIPLILEYIEYKKKYENVTFIMKNDFGPFFRILFELPIDIKMQNYLINNNLEIEKKYLLPMDTQLMNKKSLEFIKMKRAGIFTHKILEIINNWFQEQVSLYNFYVYPPNYNIDILIIERKTNVSYQSLYRKIGPKYINVFKKSGSERRYIINHKEFVENIKKRYPNKNVLNISSEYMPIFEQYYIFNNSKVVIAQHGASLANIIFMKNNCSVIEIMCKDRLNENWFLELSKSCNNLNYLQYLTSEESVTINIDKFNFYLDKVI